MLNVKDFSFGLIGIANRQRSRGQTWMEAIEGRSSVKVLVFQMVWQLTLTASFFVGLMRVISPSVIHIQEAYFLGLI